MHVRQRHRQQQLQKISVYFNTVGALVKTEEQNNKNIYLNDVSAARTVPRLITSTGEHVAAFVHLSACICVIAVSVSLSRSSGDKARPIINPHSHSRSLWYLHLGKEGPTKGQLLLWTHSEVLSFSLCANIKWLIKVKVKCTAWRHSSSRLWKQDGCDHHHESSHIFAGVYRKN